MSEIGYIHQNETLRKFDINSLTLSYGYIFEGKTSLSDRNINGDQFSESDIRDITGHSLKASLLHEDGFTFELSYQWYNDSEKPNEAEGTQVKGTLWKLKEP